MDPKLSSAWVFSIGPYHAPVQELFHVMEASRIRGPSLSKITNHPVQQCHARLGLIAFPAFAIVAETESPSRLFAPLTEKGAPNEDDTRQAQGIEAGHGRRLLEEAG
jgi:hypothetical protein